VAFRVDAVSIPHVSGDKVMLAQVQLRCLLTVAGFDTPRRGYFCQPLNAVRLRICLGWMRISGRHAAHPTLTDFAILPREHDAAASPAAPRLLDTAMPCVWRCSCPRQAILLCIALDDVVELASTCLHGSHGTLPDQAGGSACDIIVRQASDRANDAVLDAPAWTLRVLAMPGVNWLDQGH
jgi:hypothetical protein